MNFFNQYSHIFIGLSVVVIVYLLLKASGRAGWRTIFAVELGVVAFFVTGFVALRPGSGDVESLTDAEALLRNNRPTFVELFSNFCTGCLLVRPQVDDIVHDINGEFNIMRINIHAPVGREMREKFGFQFSPEFILFDRNGEEVWRGHTPPSETELELARQS